MTNVVKKVKKRTKVNPLGLSHYDFFRNEYMKLKDRAKFTPTERLFMELKFTKNKKKSINLFNSMNLFDNSKKMQLRFESRAIGKIIDLMD